MKAKFKIGDKVRIHNKNVFLRRGIPLIGPKKSSPFQKFNTQTPLLIK